MTDERTERLDARHVFVDFAKFWDQVQRANSRNTNGILGATLIDYAPWLERMRAALLTERTGERPPCPACGATKGAYHCHDCGAMFGAPEPERGDALATAERKYWERANRAIKEMQMARMNENINERLRRGEIISAGNKLYSLCRKCRQIIQINKPLFGSLHLCRLDDEETEE